MGCGDSLRPWEYFQIKKRRETYLLVRGLFKGNSDLTRSFGGQFQIAAAAILLEQTDAFVRNTSVALASLWKTTCLPKRKASVFSLGVLSRFF